jgi:hypothetical protein
MVKIILTGGNISDALEFHSVNENHHGCLFHAGGNVFRFLFLRAGRFEL